MKLQSLSKFTVILLLSIMPILALAQQETPKCEKAEDVLEKLKKDNLLDVSSEEIGIYGEVEKSQKVQLTDKFKSLTKNKVLYFVALAGGFSRNVGTEVFIFSKIESLDNRFNTTILKSEEIIGGKSSYNIKGGEIIYVTRKYEPNFLFLNFKFPKEIPFTIPKRKLPANIAKKALK